MDCEVAIALSGMDSLIVGASERGSGLRWLMGEMTTGTRDRGGYSREGGGVSRGQVYQ
jgi:hypothetical protein